MKEFLHFGVIGGGAWGTALAEVLARAGRAVTLWAREEKVVEAINARHENDVYLKGYTLDPKIGATGETKKLSECDALLLVVPVQHMRVMCQKAGDAFRDAKTPVLLCSKGIEKGDFKLPSQIVEEIWPERPLAALSGPSFAIEVAQGLPTAVTLACRDEEMGMALIRAIGGRSFRPYASTDLVGTQLGGAIKNVVAIAAGIAAGCEMGENARAALITRGLAEMMRLGRALGARPETLMGLSGMGDLVLTCSSMTSRNMSLGYALGKGRRLEEVLSERSSVAEGVPTAAAAAKLAASEGVDMPIVAAVDSILHKGARVDETVAALLSRPFKEEA